MTAAVDAIVVRNPADLSRDLCLQARLNHVGRSSMEMGIRVTQPGDPLIHVASCYITMVARLGTGDGASSAPLPPLEYVDAKEQLRSVQALKRREAYRRHLAAAEEPPSREEFETLARLHREQEQPGFSGCLAGRLVSQSWERMYPSQENVPQKIFGGYVMRRAYELASICAELAAPDRTFLVAVNRINFPNPVRIGDTLCYTSRVVYAAQGLVSVETAIERRSLDRSVRALSNSCLFTFANVGRAMQPLPIPPVYPSTYAEDARFLAARRQQAELLSEHEHAHRWCVEHAS